MYPRIERFVHRAAELLGGPDEPPADAFQCCRPRSPKAMDDDLGVPQALAVVHTTVRQGNSALRSRGRQGDRRWPASAEVRAMLGVLGLEPARPALVGGGLRRSGDPAADPASMQRPVVDSLVRLVLEQRQAARSRKDWATADAIRDQLQQSGLEIEDTPAGPRWDARRPLRDPTAHGPVRRASDPIR